MKNTDSYIHYATFEDGKKYAIIYRKIGNQTTLRCPFCNKKHEHGNEEGHRIAHCKEQISLSLADGTILSNVDGYIIEDINY
jgi:hypothetical protein